MIPMFICIVHRYLPVTLN